MKLPYKVDLSDKVVVVTGGGGILMAEFGRALAECGAKVALLDINEKAAQEVAASIGENAIGIGTNCLVKESILAARDVIHEKWGKVNFLINGAGGNSPLGTTTKDTLELKDMAEKQGKKVPDVKKAMGSRQIEYIENDIPNIVHHNLKYT